jgi:hypothetical protein
MGFLDSRLRGSDIFRLHNAISYLKNRILVPHKKRGICDKVKAESSFNPQEY